MPFTFASIEELKVKYPKVNVVGTPADLERALDTDTPVTMIDKTKIGDFPEHIPTPSKEVLENIFNRSKETIILRTKNSTIPKIDGYTTFLVPIGNTDEDAPRTFLFTALISNDEYKKACTHSTPNSSPIAFRKTPASSITSTSSLADGATSFVHNITGIDKAELLLSLYDWADCQGPKYTDPAQRALDLFTYSQSKGKISVAEKLRDSKQTQFVNVNLGCGPRLLNIDLGKDEVDFRQYEEEHGIGKAKILIAELRSKPKKSKPQKCVIC